MAFRTLAGIRPLSHETEQLLEKLVARLKQAERVQVIGHVRPDGDCIGSLLGMHHILRHFGVEHALAAGQIKRDGYSLIPGHDLIEEAPRAGFDPDLAVFVDCADRRRAFPDWPAPANTINIDHHGSNTRFAGLNWIDGQAAAVGEMLYVLACFAEVPLSGALGTALLLAIMTDTGSFRYSIVRPRHFEIAAQLLKSGADLRLVSRAAYESVSPESISITASVLSSIRYLCGGALIWSEIRAPELERIGGAEKVPENLSSELRTVRGVRVSMLFTETGEGGVRVSLRGDGTFDVSRLAGEFGGGGHPNAAGISLDGAPYEELRDRIIDRARIELDECAECDDAPVSA